MYGACLTLDNWANYNLGYRSAGLVSGPHYCGLEVFAGQGCNGTPQEVPLNFYAGSGWSPALFAAYQAQQNQSARFFCYAYGDSVEGVVLIDMAYLTRAPGGY
jgi:hypothetical protein